VKFCIEIYLKHTYKFCMKYCLEVRNYKHGDGANLLVMSDKFNIDKICISVSSSCKDDDDLKHIYICRQQNILTSL
jgi:hypothetical protein